MEPTYVATREEGGAYHVVIINLANHIILDEITIFQAREQFIQIETVDKDVVFSPTESIWDEETAMRKRDMVEFCLLTNGFHEMFNKCPVM